MSTAHPYSPSCYCAACEAAEEAKRFRAGFASAGDSRDRTRALREIADELDALALRVRAASHLGADSATLREFSDALSDLEFRARKLAVRT